MVTGELDDLAELQFDNDITVYGPEVKALAGRYLVQMIEELGKEPGLNGGTLLDDVEAIVPHQANKTMILQLAVKAGVKAERLNLNIETMGSISRRPSRWRSPTPCATSSPAPPASSHPVSARARSAATRC